MSEISDEKSYYVFFPMGYSKKQSINVWLYPYNLKLLRLTGLIYELYRKENDPEMANFYLEGLVVEKTTEKFASQYYGEIPGNYPQPIIDKAPAPNPYTSVGLKNCYIHLSDRIGTFINIQHFTDETFDYCGILKYAGRIKKYKKEIFEDIKNLCSYYCKTDEILAEYVVGNFSEFYLNYYVHVPGKYFLFSSWDSETGVNQQIWDFINSPIVLPTPEDFDTFTLSLKIDFAQVNSKFCLIFVRVEISGDGKKLLISKNFHKIRSISELYSILENILRETFPNSKKVRKTKPYSDPLQKILKRLTSDCNQENINPLVLAKKLLSYCES